MEKIGPPRLTEANHSYMKAVQDSKWQTKKIREAEVKSKKGNIVITTKSSIQEEGLLNRCLVGCLEVDVKEKPTLADVRRWSSTMWKNIFEVNIYEMSEDGFLFEFPNRHMAKQIIQGQWRGKKIVFKLDWWSPTTGCIPNSTFEKET